MQDVDCPETYRDIPADQVWRCVKSIIDDGCDNNVGWIRDIKAIRNYRTGTYDITCVRIKRFPEM
jgi:hypothetical protein